MKTHLLQIVYFQLLLFAIETDAARQKHIRESIEGKRLRHSKSGRKSKGYSQQNSSRKGKLSNESRYKNEVKSRDQTRKRTHFVESNVRTRVSQDTFFRPTRSKLNQERKEDPKSSFDVGSESSYDALEIEKDKKLDNIKSQPAGLSMTSNNYAVKVPHVQENDEVTEIPPIVYKSFSMNLHDFGPVQNEESKELWLLQPKINVTISDFSGQQNQTNLGQTTTKKIITNVSNDNFDFGWGI